MHQSKVEVYLHLVWATWRRQPFIGQELRRPLYRCIEAECRRLSCAVIALGGTADHIHLLVRLAPTAAIAKLANQVKGVSSTLARTSPAGGSVFGWQDGYAAFAVYPEHLDRAKAYVLRQEQHHSAAAVWSDWEATDLG